MTTQTNINVEALINSVQERFDYISLLNQNYKKGYKKDDYRYYERGEYFGRSFIQDICPILGIDINRLYSITRACQKWEENHHWERCFPYEENMEQIIKYLKNKPAE